MLFVVSLKETEHVERDNAQIESTHTPSSHSNLAHDNAQREDDASSKSAMRPLAVHVCRVSEESICINTARYIDCSIDAYRLAKVS